MTFRIAYVIVYVIIYVTVYVIIYVIVYVKAYVIIYVNEDTMQLKTFIKNNRREIDEIVKIYYRVLPRNDKERYIWILDDEGLYRWAHREGVNI